MATVGSGDTLELEYKCFLEDGTLVESSENRGLLRFEVDKGEVPGPIEEAARELTPGEEASVTITPENGFGAHDSGLVFTLDRRHIPRDVTTVSGSTLVLSKNGQGLSLGRIVEQTRENVTIDANHPLSGKTLHLRIKLARIIRGIGGQAILREQ